MSRELLSSLSCDPALSRRFKRRSASVHAFSFSSRTGFIDEEEEDDSQNKGKQVVVGICAMEKKSLSKPMREILTRLEEFEYITTLIFPENVILYEVVEKWPLCDCLIAFHSKGFPLVKAIRYANLRKPYIINNLEMQFDIQDRRSVYNILAKEGIEIPRHAILDRNSPDPDESSLLEFDDHVEVNGVVFNKPFVEKPISAEDHNIFMYYPTSAGGGSQRLFRKIGSRSSVYSSESGVRKDGSYIYEDFMPTDGTDVKVYTVGPDYAHAEARKSPALDGKVERDSEGKEVRYPVILSNKEKLIARKVCMAFKQMVCGFDLLRANGKSIVCDVNGFSFVKNSSKYYDDCAKILGNMILRELAPTLHIPWTMPFQLDDPPIVPTTVGKMMELRCVVGVIRHGDRTPKQKMKLEVKHPKFFEIFRKYDGFKEKHIKLKKPQQLQEILDISRELLNQIKCGSVESEMIEEKRSKLEQIKNVLEMYGHFSGINRKVQLKYQPKGRPRNTSSDDGENEWQWQLDRTLITNPPALFTDKPREASLLLILKWGGELTPSGRFQAEELGRVFRCMYPGGQGEYAGTQGLGLLRLHSTYRHDLKIYASDEGRVQMTAAAFAKGLLALEGELTPILVQMVKSANTNGLLDNDSDCSSKYQNIVKSKLHEMMQQTRDFSQEDSEQLNPCHQISITNALKFIRNPVECCKQILNLIQELNKTIESKRLEFEDSILYHGETWELMARRWSKLEKDFQNKSGLFDISKIPDIYDCIKYDLQHNRTVLQSDQAEKLYNYAQNMADVVIPQEYGMTRTEKLTIAQGICAPLLRKIRADLQRNIEEESEEDEVPVNRLNPRYSSGVSSPGRHVRTRLYFTSESHIHSLLTILAEGGLVDSKDEQWQRAMEYVSLVSELNYMTQVVIMLYEDPTKDPTSDERFHVELHFSPGVNCCVQKELPPGPGFRPHSRNQESQQNQALLEESESPRQERGDETLTGQEQKSEEPADLVAGLKSNTNSSPCLTASLKCSSADLEKVFDCIEEHTSVGPTIDENEIDISIQSSSPETQIANDLKPSEPIPIVKRVFVEDPHKDGGDGDDEAGDDDDDEEEDSDEEDYNDSRATRVGSYPETRPLDYERTQSLHEKRSKSLEKRGSRPKSLDSDSNQDGAGSKMKDVSDDSCHPSKSQSMDEVTDEDGYKRSRRRSIPSRRMSNYLKFLHELAAKGPTGARVFSTAVISGSSSAPNLKEMPAPNDNAVCSPGIRPLETLHNALSLRQLDLFLGYVTSANFKTPSPSPSRSVSSSSNYTRPPALGLFSRDSSFTMWSGPPSFVSSCESSPGLNDLFHRMRMIQLDQDDRINNAKSPSHPTH
ncbi:inositol hexakisphosphate and diphosphoinositol-pentakisphosphate kinase 2-like isoform X9 [Tigriopus californicus]|uniref:inositol hexakisphosphate and diphosphoinositol-pentakisphosphate kinase 2-like isoform X9 n=1 Tax=Tigriopus californicus TaxID=6832 RepID=UPI0027DA2950|nr:inositol hexakisphosphate and diphosphoinositol-pentakisphosphate kinase 2-like isoform X9 [Tigriopus californicus]